MHETCTVHYAQTNPWKPYFIVKRVYASWVFNKFFFFFHQSANFIWRILNRDCAKAFEKFFKWRRIQSCKGIFCRMNFGAFFHHSCHLRNVGFPFLSLRSIHEWMSSLRRIAFFYMDEENKEVILHSCEEQFLIALQVPYFNKQLC